ncbi:B12-binding domain-containing radical SAM protein [Spirochaetota bacterium]
MKILFIQPPIEDFYTTHIRTYPLGLLYIASLLVQHGHEARILNALERKKGKEIPLPVELKYLNQHYTSYDPPFFRSFCHFGYSYGYIEKKIREYSPDIVGISANFTPYFEEVISVARRVKNAGADIPVVIGGHHASVFGKEIIEDYDCIDYVITGEGAYPFLHLADHLNGKRGGEDLYSVISKNVPFKRSSAAQRIDGLEIQCNHSLLDHSRYTIGKKRYISMLASRGCPYRCGFCSVQHIFGSAIRYRSPDSIIEEITTAVRSHDIEIVNFEDDNITYDRSIFVDIMQKIITGIRKDREIELSAMNGICADKLDEETVCLMKKAGFHSLNISLVSIDSAIQKKYSRNTTVEHIEQAVREGKKQGMFITVYLIIGLPGQTKKEVRDTIDHLLGLDVLVGPSVFYPVPGSYAYDVCLDKGYITGKDWRTYRSTAASVETDTLSRKDIFELFHYCRNKNLEKKQEKA